MGENQIHTAVVVATQVDMLARLVAEAGYEVVGAAESGVNGEHLLRHFEPDVVVVENELLGPTGFDCMATLRMASPHTKALLVVHDDWRPRDLGSIGACAVVTMSRLGELVAELDGLGDWIDAQAAANSDADRRTGRDRRVHQDWSKVGWERRVDQRRAA